MHWNPTTLFVLSLSNWRGGRGGAGCAENPLRNLRKIPPPVHVTFVSVLHMFLQFPLSIWNLHQCLAYLKSVMCQLTWIQSAVN